MIYVPLELIRDLDRCHRSPCLGQKLLYFLLGLGVGTLAEMRVPDVTILVY